MATPKGYTRTQIALHWALFLLVAYQLVFGESMSHAWRQFAREGSFTPSFGVAAHIWIGIAVLVLVVPRLVIKARRGAPPLPENEPAMLKLAGNLTHLALYALLFLLPLSGLVTWYGDQPWAGEIHQLMKPLAIILIGLHVLGALYQQFVLRSDVLTRMGKPET